MPTEVTHNLLLSQVFVQPVLPIESNGVDQRGQNNRQQSSIRFMGYGNDSAGNGPLYGPSGKKAQTKVTSGEFVDIYV